MTGVRQSVYLLVHIAQRKGLCVFTVRMSVRTGILREESGNHAGSKATEQWSMEVEGDVMRI